jgi:uncharacterized protein DUF6893
MVTSALLVVAAAVGVFVLAHLLPDIKRYLRMRSM